MAINKVAYVVVCWNNKALLKECLDAIEGQTYKHASIYLIDNNSTDGSADFVEKNYPRVNLIRSDANNGFAKGNNIVIKEVMKDKDVQYVALINSDAILDKDWTTHIVQTALQKPRAAALQGITIDYYNRNLVDSHHIYMANNFQSTQYGYKELYDEKSYFTRKVMGVNAAAAIYSMAFIKSQPFNDFFDEDFFMYLEDVDVSLRALMTGWDNYFVAGAKAYHMGSASSNKRSSDFSLYYTARNQFGLLIKNIPFRVLMHNFSTFIKFEIHFILHLKKNYSNHTARVYIRGRVVGILRAPIYIVKRKKIVGSRKLSSEYLNEVISKKGFIS